MLKKIKAFTFIFIIVGNIVYAKWENWAKNQHCHTPIIIPKNTQELIDIIKKATQEHKTVRPYGTAHSWSNLVCNDGYIINTEKLNSIISVDKDTNQVVVQAGIKLKDLNEQLAAYGLCLSNQGAITEQSLAGVVSTATHGSGKTGTYASFITQVKLLTADGANKEPRSKLRRYLKSFNFKDPITFSVQTFLDLADTKFYNLH